MPHWSASLLETTHWFRLKKNLEKCGNSLCTDVPPPSEKKSGEDIFSEGGGTSVHRLCGNKLRKSAFTYHPKLWWPCITPFEYPFLTYCIVAWSSTYCSNLNCIYPLQKRLVRIITKAQYLANTAPLFSQLKVLDIFSINSFSVATFMYSYHHNLLPSSFRDLFLSSNQVHQYETRLASEYWPHFCRTNIKQFSILYRGRKIWNSLPVSLISSPSISVF